MKDEQLNIGQMLSTALKYWYLFLIILPLSLGAGYYFIKTSQPKFQSKALILIEDKKDAGQVSEEAFFKELSQTGNNKNLANEILVLRSRPIIEKVVRKNKLNYQYFIENDIVKKELYKSSPVAVSDWKTNQDIYLKSNIEIQSDSNYQLIVEQVATREDDQFQDKIFSKYGTNFNGKFNDTLSLPFGELVLTKTNHDAEGKLILIISSIENMTKYIAGNVEIEVLGEESSTLRLSYQDVSGTRAKDILTDVIETYNNRITDEKNQVYKSTMDLINNRIQLIADELTASEQSIESYKKKYQITDLNAEGTLLMGELANYDKQLSDEGVQLEILNSIESFLLKNKKNFEFVPTNLSLNNLTLTNQLENFNQELDNRAKIRTDFGPSHPDVILAEKQVQKLRKSIINQIGSIKKDLNIMKRANQDLKVKFNSRLRSLPKRERELVEKERQKKIKENLYLYLLEKREEAAITLAITSIPAKVIDPPSVSDSKTSKAAQIGLISLFFGMAIPFGMALFFESFNDKLLSKEEIEDRVAIPITSQLADCPNEGNAVVNENKNTAITEMFHMLNFDLGNSLAGIKMKTLLVTSSISGEGKSFISLNLGLAKAISGKKVLIMELDFRKPRTNSQYDTEPRELDVTDYLLDESIHSEEIIFNSELHANLDFIVVDKKRFNPNKMIFSSRLFQLIELQKVKYDFIILDAPPIGIVSDAHQLAKISDATLYILRHSYTRQSHLKILEDVYKKNKLPNLHVVYNGAPMTKRHGYGYLNNTSYFQ